MVRSSAVEAARLEDEIRQINERRMPRWHVFASSSGKDFYATRMGKVRPVLMEHEGYARTVHAVKLDVLEALMDEQDDIGWLKTSLDPADSSGGTPSLPTAIGQNPDRAVTPMAVAVGSAVPRWLGRG